MSRSEVPGAEPVAPAAETVKIVAGAETVKIEANEEVSKLDDDVPAAAAEGEIRAWLALCGGLVCRAPDIDRGRLTRAALDHIVCGCLPTQLRPKTVYSPLLAAAWKAALGVDGDAWYAAVHPPEQLSLPANRFATWCATPLCRARVHANILWLLHRHRLSRGSLLASVVHWHRVLQAAYDFHLPQLFNVVRHAALADRPWNPPQQAILQLIS